MFLRKRHGSLSAEALVSLFIAMLCLPVTVTVCGVMAGMTAFDEELQDDIAILQVQRILIGAYDVHTDGQCLYFHTQMKDFRMSKVNDHLIIQPGTQIVLADIADASFREKDHVITMVYERGEKQYEAVLAPLP